MRRKIASIIGAALSGIISWSILYYLEVSGVITSENSHWLLIGSIVGVIILVLVLIWGFWPEFKRIIRRDGTKTETGNSKVGKKPRIFRSLLMLSDQYTHKCSQCGFGVVVNKYDMGVVCPNCGNADDIIPRL